MFTAKPFLIVKFSRNKQLEQKFVRHLKKIMKK
jgi:hypothetical protein